MLKTPFYDIHLKLGAKISPFGGWLMPIQYEGILAEHMHTRNSVSVFDICHMGEFLLETDTCLSGLDRIVTQNLTSMPQGSCRYGFMLNEKAGIVDDLVIYRKGEASWMLVVNAATTASDYAHLKENLKGNFKLEDVSPKLAKLDVQGPFSLEVLKKIFGDSLDRLKYYSFSHFIFHKEKCLISRTGYTGELGYEIYLDNDRAVKLWEALLNDALVKPAGLGCRDTLRLEMGYPLYGQDLDTGRSPMAAGLMKFVDLNKEFIGKQALIEEKNKPVERFICLKAESRRAPRHGFSIYQKENKVGIITSGSFSPSLCAGIGMGYVLEDYEIGSELLVKDANLQIPVKVVARPFLNKSRLLGPKQNAVLT